MSGQQIGSVVGGIIGSFIPVIGTALGSVIGGMIGGWIAPTQIRGPKLSDGMAVTAQDGIANPWGFGTFPVGCNIIWTADIVEHENTDDGKGSGQEVTTYSYTRSYAVGICRGIRNTDGTYSSIAGILRATKNGKVVYDVSPDKQVSMAGQNAKFLRNHTFYLGGDDQLPDPTIESYLGVGNAPAYPGEVYMVAEDDETQQGEVAQWEFVVCMNGTASIVPGGIYWSYDDRITSSRGEVLLSNDSQDAQGIRYDPEANPPFYAGVRGRTGRRLGKRCIQFNVIADDNTLTGAIGLATLASNLAETQYTNFESIVHDFGTRFSIGGVNSLYGSLTDGSELLIAVDFDTPACWMRINGEWAYGVDPESSPDGLNALLSATMPDGELFPVFSVVPGTAATTKVRMITDASEMTAPPAGFLGWGFNGIPVPDAPGVYIDAMGNVFTADDSTTLSLDEFPLAQVVAECCRRSGLTSVDFDVSQLTDLITGFKVASLDVTGESIIQSLMPGYIFDAMESDDVLTFVKRGGGAAFAIDMDDLAEREGDAVEEIQAQEVELLRKVNVRAMDPAAGYVVTTQTAERRTSTVAAKGEQTIEIPVVTDHDAMAQMAAKRLKVAWGEPRTFKFTLPYVRPEITVSDVGTMTDRKGRTQRIRVMEMSEDEGRIDVIASLDRQAAYTSEVQGVPALPPADTSPGLIGPTLGWVGNLPSLRTSDNVPGVYLAGRGYLSAWGGYAVFLSVDEGASYQRVAAYNLASQLGNLTSGVTEIGEPISVFEPIGTLSSITDAQMASRQNAFAITTDGESEIGQFKTATPGGGGLYSLTDTLRGLLGTTALTHEMGDPFVMLSTVHFLPLDISLAGKNLLFKFVSFGTSLDETSEYPFLFLPKFTSVTVDIYTDNAGNPYTDDAGNTYFYEVAA